MSSADPAGLKAVWSCLNKVDNLFLQWAKTTHAMSERIVAQQATIDEHTVTIHNLTTRLIQLEFAVNGEN